MRRDTWASTPQARDEQLAILLNAYAGERAYDAQTLSTLTGVFATIIGVLSVVGSALAFGTLHPHGLIELFTAVLPIIPVPFLAWGAVCAHNVIVRGEVIAIYEDALRRYARLSILETDGGAGLPVPFGNAVVGRVWWASGSLMMSGAFFVIACMYLGILGASAYKSWSHDVPLTIVVLVVSLVAFSTLTRSYLRAFAPKTFVEETAKKLLGVTIDLPGPRREELPLSAMRDAVTHRFTAEPVIARIIGYNIKRWVIVNILGFVFTGAIAYLVYERFHRPSPQPRTRALIDAGSLATAMNSGSVPRVTQLGDGGWFVQIDPHTCFRVSTRKFDLETTHGFAVVSCAIQPRPSQPDRAAGK